MALHLACIFKSPPVQPPTSVHTGADLQAIIETLRGAGILKREAA